MITERTPTLLCILDGVGLAPRSEGNAVALSETPTFDSLLNGKASSQLRTDGTFVGLPAGQMGNSEVGHMTIGSGRIIRQSLAQISHDLQTNEFQNRPAFKTFLNEASESRVIHLIGLLSNGGVHSHIDHIITLAQKLVLLGHTVRIHAILDGRDTDPMSGVEFLDSTEAKIRKLENCSIASIVGRFFGMDRDNRWERMDNAWRLWTEAKGEFAPDPIARLKQFYADGTTDEFIPPIVCAPEDARSKIADGDSVIACNFRADRARQIVELLAQDTLGEKLTPVIKPRAIATFTEYSSAFNDLAHVYYPNEEIVDTLGEIMAKSGKKQLRISETEKYAHVTYYLNCGREMPYEGETRILVDSPKEVATYDLKPEMSLPEVTTRLVAEIQNNSFDLIVLNIANGDQVGHTGVISAAKTAMEHVDAALAKITEALKSVGGQCLIIADHGNVEEMLINSDVSTAHSTNPVPCIYAGPKEIELLDGGLEDVAPTLLDLMGLDQPTTMTGRSLVIQV